MKKAAMFLVFVQLFIFANIQPLDNSFKLTDKKAFAQPELIHLSNALSGIKASDLSLGISFIRSSDMESRDIADTIIKWDPDEHKRSLAAIFRGKITRLAERLKRVDYEQLIIDIDIIKNSHMTTAQLITLLKGTKLGEKIK